MQLVFLKFLGVRTELGRISNLPCTLFCQVVFNRFTIGQHTQHLELPERHFELPKQQFCWPSGGF